MAERLKIIVEQVGPTAWVWEIHDAMPVTRGRRVLANSVNNGEYGCFATPERAFADAVSVSAGLVTTP